MRGALGGPRVLLRRLREVMAEPVSAQERLDKIVVLIAANMVAEVCSVYVLRVDGTLELYATEGLKREAVHQTVLRQDEGLVGLVASEANPINLSDAQTHPAFSFRPETGEEIYHSFLGVPILRAGNTLGVLVVQNRARRTYSEEEEEALQTTAMVLAEMIASGELSVDRQARRRARGPAAAAPAPASRSPTASRSATSCCTSRASSVKNVIADDVQKELKRLDEAIGDAARRSRPHAGARRRRRRRRAPRRARSLPHVRARPGLAAPAARSGDDRPHRRGRRRARAVRHPRAHAARHRSLSARAPARPRRSRQPPDAPAHGPGPRAAARATAGQRRSWWRARWARRRCSTTTAASCAAWCWRKAARPRMSRSWRARSASRRSARSTTPPAWSMPATPIIVDGTTGDVHRAAGRRHRERLCRAGAAARPPAGAVPRAARQAVRHQGRPEASR